MNTNGLNVQDLGLQNKWALMGLFKKEMERSAKDDVTVNTDPENKKHYKTRVAQDFYIHANRVITEYLSKVEEEIFNTSSIHDDILYHTTPISHGFNILMSHSIKTRNDENGIKRINDDDMFSSIGKVFLSPTVGFFMSQICGVGSKNYMGDALIFCIDKNKIMNDLHKRFSYVTKEIKEAYLETPASIPNAKVLQYVEEYLGCPVLNEVEYFSTSDIPLEYVKRIYHIKLLDTNCVIDLCGEDEWKLYKLGSSRNKLTGQGV
ncbi:hypothetical protein [Aneurinibacillus tyrosinisolvens]|uniref:hypothetical protein n=1 Tax=Aneurinibacillus tyrosinisolvens TaxID=1443435 RepID=UPI00063EF8C2|nr:hypothetical protein [Aneurinibacillus tyrosinisolvens]